MIGKIISNYRIEKKIGEGGMSNVYLGKHIKFERKVAIKILHASLSTKSKIRNRFKNEAYILSTLKHPNIVTLYDYIELDNTAYLIMEYVDGITLDNYVKKKSGPVPENKLINFFTQILTTIQFAHERKIVHRDIKPSNFILTQDDKIKILDFGISKLLSSPDLNHTSVGAKLGTLPYMSPEQVRGENVDELSDIYSLGVTLFHLATGRSAYHDLEITNKEFEISNKIVHEPLPKPQEVYPGVTKHISKIIQKATQKEKQNRYANCKVFLEDLLIINKPKTQNESSIHATTSRTFNTPPIKPKNISHNTKKPHAAKKPTTSPALITDNKKNETFFNVIFIAFVVGLFLFLFIISRSTHTISSQQNIETTSNYDNNNNQPQEPSAQKEPEPHTYINSMINKGDSCMNIRKYGKALKYYQEALSCGDYDDTLSEKISNARKLNNFIETHTKIPFVKGWSESEAISKLKQYNLKIKDTFYIPSSYNNMGKVIKLIPPQGKTVKKYSYVNVFIGK